MPPAQRTWDELVAHFWTKVRRGDGCWLWEAARNSRGYGMFGVPLNVARAAGQQPTILSHRFAWWAEHGERPAMQILHRCDNPPCVRPDHLFIGTHDDNMRDKAQKGRGGGEKHPQAKLTQEQVEEVRQRRAAGQMLARIADEYGISEGHVCRLARGGRWKVLQ